MKKMKFLVYFTIFFFLCFTTNALAANFVAYVSPTLINASIIQQLNFTITNLDTNENITQVNITFNPIFKIIGGPSGCALIGLNIVSCTGDLNIIPTLQSKSFIISINATSIGNYGFSVSTLDTVGNNVTNITNEITVQDITSPWYSDLNVSPASPTVYSFNKSYQFSIRWNDNIALHTVIFSFGGKNYTLNITNISEVYTITLSNLSAGNYSYYWFANDTSGNFNKTTLAWYNITKAINPINIWFNSTMNQNITLTNGSILIVNATGVGQLNLTIYKDSTWEAGPLNSSQLPHTLTLYSTYRYNFTAAASGNENYTSGTATYFVMVVPSYNISTNIPSYYSSIRTTFNITFSSPPGFGLIIEGNWSGSVVKYEMTNISNTTFSYSTTLPAGIFYWQIYGNYSNYVFNLTSKNSFTVNKATPTLELIATPSWTVAKGTQTTVSCFSDQVSVKLYRNNSLVSNPDTQNLPEGVYVYKCNNSETANYSSTNVTNTLVVKIYLTNLTFVKAEDLILVKQNSSNSTIVGIKNNGDLSQNISFTIESINSSWFTLNATNISLTPGKTAYFLVNFSVGEVEVKDYNGIFKAYSPNQTITSNFTLRVLPSQEKEILINLSLIGYKEEMSELEREINQAKAQGVNVSLVEEKYNQLKEKIGQAENYTVKGDYFNAYLILKEVETLVKDTKNELNKVKQAIEEKSRRNLILYAIIAISVVFVIIFIYLLWPMKPEIVPKQEIRKEKIWFKLKQKLKELTKKKYKYKP